MDYQFKYKNKHYGFPVMTKQEIDLMFNPISSIKCDYRIIILKLFIRISSQEEFCRAWDIELDSNATE